MQIISTPLLPHKYWNLLHLYFAYFVIFINAEYYFRGKKKNVLKDLHLKNQFSCAYAKSFILEILQILSLDRFIYGIFTYVSVRVLHFYLTEEFDLWGFTSLGTSLGILALPCPENISCPLPDWE